VERLYRGGSQHIGKPHFTRLYDRARQRAFTPRNIRAGWNKTGHYPWNPDFVLHQLQPPLSSPSILSPPPPKANQSQTRPYFTTPKTSDAVVSLRRKIETDLDNGILNTPSKLRITKLCNAAENAFADRSLLLDENQLLFEQNCERNIRKSVQLKIVGTAKVLSYEDFCEAEGLRDLKNMATQANLGLEVMAILGCRNKILGKGHEAKI
jgi:hypothetical protein